MNQLKKECCEPYRLQQQAFIWELTVKGTACTLRDTQSIKPAAPTWELPQTSSVQHASGELLNRWTWDQFTTNTFRKEPHPA